MKVNGSQANTSLQGKVEVQRSSASNGNANRVLGDENIQRLGQLQSLGTSIVFNVVSHYPGSTAKLALIG